jgi:hypothetical protein
MFRASRQPPRDDAGEDVVSTAPSSNDGKPLNHAAVAFVDTDGDRVEYRMNSTSGKLDVFVNGQLKGKGLTKLTRDGATLTPLRRTAPDEDTAQRVIALFNLAEAGLSADIAGPARSDPSVSISGFQGEYANGHKVIGQQTVTNSCGVTTTVQLVDYYGQVGMVGGMSVLD